MKQWKQPKLFVLGVQATNNDITPFHNPQIGHLCHRNPTETCTDLTNGSHNSMGNPHSEPKWYTDGAHNLDHNDSHPNGHTCCCYGLTS